MNNQETAQALPAVTPISDTTLAQLPTEVSKAFLQMAQATVSMANMMRATNERIASMEREIRLLTKVTPAQASAINTAIRDRAGALCSDYRAPGCEKAVANAIRRALKLTTGVSSVRELPRCEYSVALQSVQIWDDYKAMKAIKAKGGTKA